MLGWWIDHCQCRVDFRCWVNWTILQDPLQIHRWIDHQLEKNGRNPRAHSRSMPYLAQECQHLAGNGHDCCDPCDRVIIHSPLFNTFPIFPKKYQEKHGGCHPRPISPWDWRFGVAVALPRISTASPAIRSCRSFSWAFPMAFRVFPIFSMFYPRYKVSNPASPGTPSPSRVQRFYTGSAWQPWELLLFCSDDAAWCCLPSWDFVIHHEFGSGMGSCAAEDCALGRSNYRALGGMPCPKWILTWAYFAQKNRQQKHQQKRPLICHDLPSG